MTARVIAGRGLATDIKGQLRHAVEVAAAHDRRRPGLAVVKVGDNPASEVYVRNKGKACAEVGMRSIAHDLPHSTSEIELLKLLEHIGARFTGQHAVVIGASNIVGRPMSLELRLMGATVTVCHRFTTGLERHVNRADILGVAAGKPTWITPVPGGVGPMTVAMLMHNTFEASHRRQELGR